MSDKISAGIGGIGTPSREPASTRQFIPMQVGKATVYVEQVGQPAVVEADDRIRPVAPSPKEAFENAVEVLQECIHVVGGKVEMLAEKAKPQEITVEFTLTFGATGKMTLIPVLVTGETTASTGLKVTAVWRQPEVEQGRP
jgi:Trypsin-co-occurring domain 1